MRYVSLLLLAVTMVTMVGAAAWGMPLSPRALEKALNAGMLSDAILAPPPEGVNSGFPIPALGHSGSYKILIIVVEYTDVGNVYSHASFDSMAFTSWPTGTMNDYYTEASYGNLTLSGTVLGWHTVSHTRAYYGNNQKGWGTYPQNTARLVEEAVDSAEVHGCDFSQFDNDGDGKAESIIIVHCGEGAETSLDANDIQSHVSTISGMGGTPRTYDGVTIDRYACCPELQSSLPAAHINIGVFCHEYGHVLGLPDLYDVSRWCTSINSWGIGAFGLMCYGGWGGDVQSPQSPTHMCSWSKIQLGWLTPTIISGGPHAVTLGRFEEYPQVLKIGMDTRETQYFLVEYRDSSYGFDRSLSKRGLLIFHVDDDMWSENDCEDGGTCTSGGFHYMVALEQPDGNFHLDCGATGNYGDRGDMYPYAGINYFDATTTPDSKTYDGSLSGVSINNIAFGGSGQMTMNASGGLLYPEIAYDDGYYNTCWRYGLNDAGFAVRVTPPAHPAVIRGLLIMSCDAYNRDFRCRIYDASGTGGNPGSPISPIRTVYGATALDWTYADFEADSIVVDSGDFWAVYMEYNNSQLASDTDSPWSGRTKTYWAGTFSNDNGAYGNYMIRAVVDTQSCAGITPVAQPEMVASVSPNPFKKQAVISFSLDRTAPVSISVYDVAGRLVKDLANNPFPAGRHEVKWDGTDYAGRSVSAGVYFYRVASDKNLVTGKVSLLR
jgi:immune inhibitor A